MPIRVPYQSGTDAQGRKFFSVLLQVRLAGARSEASVVSMVDSGASICVFTGAVAELLGLDLESGVRAETTGISGVEPVWLHPITLKLPGGPVAILAGFQRNLPISGILGMSGFFEHFRITFDGAAKVCEFERLPKMV